jgi:DNA-binding transcriptional ArsR family regulator
MVNYNQRPLDLAFGALAHPIRRGILARLATGDATVAELAKPFKVSAPAISKHMRILENAGLLSRRKLGREHRCRLEQRRMKEAEQWIERQRAFWNDRLDALERYLKEDAAAQARKGAKR